MQQKFFAVPFAAAGDVADIPTPAQVDGSMSLTEGFGFDYQRDLATDPDAKRIPRDKTNQLYKWITENIGAYQRTGFPEWITAANNGGVAFAYGINSYVRWNGGAGTDWVVYASLIDGAVKEPGVAVDWEDEWAIVAPVSPADLRATQAETDQGTGTKLVGAVELVRSAREGKWGFLGDLNQAGAPAYTGAFAGAAAFAQGAGAKVSFTVAAPNATGGLTLKVGANGALPLRNFDGTDLEAGDLAVGTIYEAMSNGAQWRLETITASRLALYASSGDGAIFGYLFTNTPGAPNTQVTMSAGNCRDSTNQRSIPRPVPMTKRLDQPWAQGNGNGGRTGALAVGPNQTWWIHAVLKDSTGETDLILNQSYANPDLPAGGWGYFRPLYAILTDGAGLIRQVLHYPDGDTTKFKNGARGVEFNATANGVLAGTLRNLGVPTGVKVEAEIYYQSQNVGGSNPNPAFSGGFDPDLGAVIAPGNPTQYWDVRVAWVSAVADRYVTKKIRVWTNTAGQIITASNDTGDTLGGGVLGWVFPRGRF